MTLSLTINKTCPQAIHFIRNFVSVVYFAVDRNSNFLSVFSEDEYIFLIFYFIETALIAENLQTAGVTVVARGNC